MTRAEKLGAHQIVIDKDSGRQIVALAPVGTYLTLENGKLTGFAPLEVERATALALRAADLIIADQDAQVWHGIRRVGFVATPGGAASVAPAGRFNFQMPCEKRSLRHARQLQPP